MTVMPKEQEALDYASSENDGLMGVLMRNIEVPPEMFQQALRDSYQAAKRLGATGWSRMPKSIFFLPTIDPGSWFAMMWGVLSLLFDVIFTAFWVPLGVAFCSLDYGNLELGCVKAELIGGVFYAMNLLLGFQVGAVLTLNIKRMVVLDGRIVARAYMKHGRFWLDAIAVVPFLYLVAIIASNLDTGSHVWVSFVSLLRLVRMFRVFSLSRVVYIDASAGPLKSFMKAALGGVMGTYVLLLACLMCIIINLQACLLIVSAIFNGRENSWMANQINFDLTTASEPDQWYQAVYLVIMTDTSLGSWGLNPLNFSDMVLLNLYMLMGMVMFGVLVASATYFVTSAGLKTRAQYGLSLKMNRVHRFIRAHRLPGELAHKLKVFYRIDWVNMRSMDAVPEDPMDQLPADLRNDVAVDILDQLLVRLPWTSAISAAARAVLASMMVASNVEPGKELCSEGDEPSCLWLLESGSVAVLNLVGEELFALEAPAIFGDGVLLMDDVPSCRDRLWAYRTSGNAVCRLWRLSSGDCTAAMRVCPGIRTAFLVYLQMRLLQQLNGYRTDERWCEVVARVMVVLEGAPQSVTDEVARQLQRASRNDSSLQLLFDALLELASLSQVSGEDIGAALATSASASGIAMSMEANVSVNSAADEPRDSDATSDAAIEAAEESESVGPLLGSRRASSAGSGGGGQWARDTSPRATPAASLTSLLHTLSVRKSAEDREGAVGGEVGESHRATLQRLTASSSSSAHPLSFRTTSLRGGADAGGFAARSSAPARSHSLQAQSIGSGDGGGFGGGSAFAAGGAGAFGGGGGRGLLTSSCFGGSGSRGFEATADAAIAAVNAERLYVEVAVPQRAHPAHGGPAGADTARTRDMAIPTAPQPATLASPSGASPPLSRRGSGGVPEGREWSASGDTASPRGSLGGGGGAGGYPFLWRDSVFGSAPCHMCRLGQGVVLRRGSASGRGSSGLESVPEAGGGASGLGSLPETGGVGASASMLEAVGGASGLEPVPEAGSVGASASVPQAVGGASGLEPVPEAGGVGASASVLEAGGGASGLEPVPEAGGVGASASVPEAVGGASRLKPVSEAGGVGASASVPEAGGVGASASTAMAAPGAHAGLERLASDRLAPGGGGSAAGGDARAGDRGSRRGGSPGGDASAAGGGRGGGPGDGQRRGGGSGGGGDGPAGGGERGAVPPAPGDSSTRSDSSTNTNTSDSGQRGGAPQGGGG
ncbi:hypothetical protein FOA52_009670 [Chlamydomonas sp. UWO 241]|nr:hypothetical protein FOA52_009670 [Chlamydomonas sp. UWO 241]